MHGNDSRRSHPLPPARTRWPDPEEVENPEGGSFLGPVRSGLYGKLDAIPAGEAYPRRMTAPAPDVETSSPELLPGSIPDGFDSGTGTGRAQSDEAARWAVDEEVEGAAGGGEPTWDSPDDSREDEAAWGALEASGLAEADWDDPDGSEAEDGWISAAADAAWDTNDDLVLGADDEAGEIDDDEAGEFELVLEADSAFTIEVEDDADEESVGQRSGSESDSSPDDAPTGSRAPLSAWDLGTNRPEQEIAGRAERARREWQALGESLAQSVSTDPDDPTLPASVPDDFPSGGEVAGLEPIGASLHSDFARRPESATKVVDERVPPELEELAHRLEQFAAALRSDGVRAMAVAQNRGDPVDVFLAGLAAGYLGGRRE